MTSGFADLDAAFKAASVELGEATPSVPEETMPVSEGEVDVSGEQADEGTVEQPEVAETTDTDVDDELQTLVDEIGDSEGEAEAEKPTAEPIAEFIASDDFWTTEVEVPVGDGTETMTLQVLADGFLRQSDYTQKTQALAEARKANEEAVEFHKAFEEDPMAFAYTLAVKANLVEEGAQPAKPIDVAKFVSPEDAETELARRVEERFTTDPRFTAMETAESQGRINTAFGQLEQDRGVTLSDQVREHLLDLALASGTTDLAQVFDAEMYRKQLNRQRTDEAKRKAPSRPARATGAVDTGPKAPVVDTIDDAFKLAQAELGQA